MKVVKNKQPSENYHGLPKKKIKLEKNEKSEVNVPKSAAEDLTSQIKGTFFTS